jgi:hypothetical protein
MNGCQEKSWKNGTLPSWNEMLRIFVLVTLNTGWSWVIFIRFDFKKPRKGGGLEVRGAPSMGEVEANEVGHLSSEMGLVPGLSKV